MEAVEILKNFVVSLVGHPFLHFSSVPLPSYVLLTFNIIEWILKFLFFYGWLVVDVLEYVKTEEL